MVVVKKMSVLINFLLQNTNQSLAKSAQILLVMSDRTDEFLELWNYTITYFEGYCVISQ